MANLYSSFDLLCFSYLSKPIEARLVELFSVEAEDCKLQLLKMELEPSKTDSVGEKVLVTLGAAIAFF